MLKLPNPNVTAEHTVYLSYKGASVRLSFLVTHYSRSCLLAVKETKLYENLTIRMWPATITLNYSVENIRNDVYQKIIVVQVKFKLYPLTQVLLKLRFTAMERLSDY